MYYVKLHKEGYEVAEARSGRGIVVTPNLLDALHYCRISNREERKNVRESKQAAVA
jgi:hypothetical protein